MGAGAVGLLTAAMARQSGCSSVTIVDVDQGRVDYALAHGFATHGYVVPPQSTSASTPEGALTPASNFFACTALERKLEAARGLAQRILGVSSKMGCEDGEDDAEGVDVTFECTGKETCMHTSLYATRPGGKLIMVGMGTPIQTLPMSVAHLREVDILGIFRYANTYATGIQLLRAAARGGGGGLVLPRVDDMVTHRFKGLHRAQEAFELASRTVDDDGRLVLKVVIEA